MRLSMCNPAAHYRNRYRDSMPNIRHNSGTHNCGRRGGTIVEPSGVKDTTRNLTESTYLGSLGLKRLHGTDIDTLPIYYICAACLLVELLRLEAWTVSDYVAYFWTLYSYWLTHPSLIEQEMPSLAASWYTMACWDLRDTELQLQRNSGNELDRGGDRVRNLEQKREEKLWFWYKMKRKEQKQTSNK